MPAESCLACELRHREEAECGGWVADKCPEALDSLQICPVLIDVAACAQQCLQDDSSWRPYIEAVVVMTSTGF
jgi:hypothetical protein